MIDFDQVIERERSSRRTLVKLRQCLAGVVRRGPGDPEETFRLAVEALSLAEASLEWGLAVSRQLKRVAAESRD